MATLSPVTVVWRPRADWALAEVPVVALHGLTELQRRQLVLADNRIALNAGWDLEMLSLELKIFSALGADLSVLGFHA